MKIEGEPRELADFVLSIQGKLIKPQGLKFKMLTPCSKLNISAVDKSFSDIAQLFGGGGSGVN